MNNLNIKGYTIIELCITLALIGILCAFSLPINHYFFSAKKLEILRAEIKNVVRFARTYALINNKILILKPVVSSANWSQGATLIEASTQKIIYQWHWWRSKINVSWVGFNSNRYLVFAPDLKHSAVNGYFKLSYPSLDPLTVIVNRLGHAH